MQKTIKNAGQQEITKTPDQALQGEDRRTSPPPRGRQGVGKWGGWEKHERTGKSVILAMEVVGRSNKLSEKDYPQRTNAGCSGKRPKRQGFQKVEEAGKGQVEENHPVYGGESGTKKKKATWGADGSRVPRDKGKTTA